MNEIHNTADMVIKALRRARQLGQDYWQYSDSEYRSDWKKADATLDAFDQLVADTKAALSSNSGAQTAPSVPECPYPCGWRNLLKYAIEDGAYLARSINEDDPVTENARAVTMRMVMRLRDVLMAVNNAAPEAKP